ncbi:MAG: radical SAM protein [Deltaproteobacteria bacterium]|nr:radical SAM protein [Deltaproteobacteria bacterium]
MPVNSEKVIQSIRDAGLQPPEMLTLMITGRCNLQCRHCWLDCRADSAAGPVPKNVVRSIIDDFVRLGGTGLTLTGGEVLTHSDWLEIVVFACEHQGLKDVCLQTNAMLVTPHMAAELNALSSRKLSIQISMDGASAKSHDLVRGKGSFDLLLRGLDCLLDAGMGPRIRIAFTEMVHNFGEIPRLMKRLETFGIRRMVSSTLVKDGRAGRTKRLKLPTPNQVAEVVNRYRSDAAFRSLYDKMGSISAIEWTKGRSIPATQVCSCIKTPFITAQGRMCPCVMLPAEKYSIGHIHQRSMVDAVLAALPLWAQLPVMERKRRETLKNCGGCPGEAHCGGGCMGRAYAACGDLLSVEDRCALRRAVYQLG